MEQKEGEGEEAVQFTCRIKKKIICKFLFCSSSREKILTKNKIKKYFFWQDGVLER